MKAKLLLLVFALAFAVPSFATTITVDFGGGLGGTIDALKGGGEVGTGIAIDTIQVLVDGSPYPGSPYTGLPATLDFSTVTGAFDISILGTPLLTGTMVPGDTSFVLQGTMKNGNYSFTTDGTNTLPILSLIGIPGWDSVEGGFGGFSITAGTKSTPDGNGGKLYNVLSTDFQSTVTPEPMSMLLLGTFLSLGGGILNRKKRA